MEVGHDTPKCVECGGSGTVIISIKKSDGKTVYVKNACRHCNGSGLEPLT